MDCIIYVAKTKALISCAADLRHCFFICENKVFSRRGPNKVSLCTENVMGLLKDFQREALLEHPSRLSTLE